MSSLDFTWISYKELLIAFQKNGYVFSTVIDFLENDNVNKKTVILRHDIDKKPEMALLMAYHEKKFNITGTYYFRVNPKVLNERIVKEISELGHEIGYHYEDLTKYHGNYELAIRSFEHNLELLRSVVPIDTICMDGRPLSPHNNLDLWKKFDYKDYGIKGEPYLELDFEEILYLTDTSRGWNKERFNVRDKVRNSFDYLNRSTHHLMEDIASGELPDKILLTLHPQRWNISILPWTQEFIVQNLKNLLKWGLIKVRKTERM